MTTVLSAMGQKTVKDYTGDSQLYKETFSSTDNINEPPEPNAPSNTILTVASYR